MIDLALVRAEPDALAAALARRGVSAQTVADLVSSDVEHRRLLRESERLRAEVKELSRQVAAARREGDEARAAALTEASRALGEEERVARESTERAGELVRALIVALPNLPDPRVPDGADETDNVEFARWWPGKDQGSPAPAYADHQRVAHWEIGAELSILDLEAGARLAGSMFPLYRGDGARLIRALGAFALDRHADAYEEVRPPTFALTETMQATGHLPKSADDMYAIERDGLWAIPTAEVPLTSLRRGEILEERELPVRLSALTPCFRREAGAAGRDTRGLLRVHEFDKVELFAYCTPDQMEACHADILERAESLLRELELSFRLVTLCTGDLGTASAYTVDLEVYSPGVDRWLEVSSVSWFTDYQARRANVRYRRADGTLGFVSTVNGSALAWARIWAALVETGRQADGTVLLPEALASYLGGRRVIEPRPPLPRSDSPPRAPS